MFETVCDGQKLKLNESKVNKLETMNKPFNLNLFHI